MKPYLKIVVVASMFASVCYWNSINTTEQVKSLVLQNVEALADDEGSGNSVTCYSSSSAKSGATYYDCGHCTREFNSTGKGNSSLFLIK